MARTGGPHRPGRWAAALLPLAVAGLLCGHRAPAVTGPGPGSARPAVVAAAPDPSRTPRTDRSRAGSRPGEGRLRPGRSPSSGDADGEPPARGADGVPTYTDRDPPGLSPRPRVSARPWRSPVPRGEAESRARAGTRPLSLGAGLVLLGLGLGFLALRLRRG